MTEPSPRPAAPLTRPASPAGWWQRLRHLPVWSRLRTHRLRPGRRTAAWLLVFVVALTGTVLGLLLGSRTGVDVGPFNAELFLTPAPAGETSVLIPPLGSLHLDTHDSPVQLTIALGALDQARTQEMITDPGGVTRAAETVADDVIAGVVRLGFGSLAAAVLGAMLLAALVFRNMRRVAISGGLALALMLASFGAAALTFRLDAIEEPRYEGLLVNAPALVGDVQRIANDYERYTENLQSMVGNISTLYTAASTLEAGAFTPDESMTRVLHVTDLHLNPASWQIMRTVVEQYRVDFIIDTGDIVDWGTGPESRYLDSIRLMGVPYVYVRGNHDSPLTQQAVADQPNAIVLDNEVTTVAGLTIAGIGDPRFTPDQQTGPFTDEERAAAQQEVVNAGGVLAETVRAYGQPVHIASVHDPIAATRLDGVVPIVLAGHAHDRRVEPVAPPADDAEIELAPDDTLLMVQGSTGGAGLRGLEGEHPASLALSVLYFDSQQRLVAYDDITIGGHGLSEASVERHLVTPPHGVAPAEDPAESEGD